MVNVNIIMSVYNGEKYLATQIDSILGSTINNWKLFIVDDGSSDSTFKIASDYSEKHKHKIYAFKNASNMGSTKSFLYNLCRVSDKNVKNEKLNIVNRYKKKVTKKFSKKLVNAAISLKKTALDLYRRPKFRQQKGKCFEYYMFADQDDFWLMDKVALTLKKMRKTENRHGKHKPVMVFTDAIIADDNLKFVDKSFFEVNHMKPKKKNFAHLLMENKCPGCTVMVNQAACDLLRRTYPAFDGNEKYAAAYDSVRYHDWWMALICSAFGCVKYLDVPTIMYRQHASNQVGQTSFSEYVKERFSEIKNVGRRLDDTFKQAKSFRECYGADLKKKKLAMLEKFAGLNTATPLKRRYYIIRYGFFKSGFIRNAALLLYI